MMKNLKLIFGISAVMIASNGFSQQDPQFTQYFDQMLYVNPAYAGSNDMLSITGIHREQWVGFDGRPRSSSLSIHSPLGKNIGAGLTAVNDIIGPLNQTMLYGDISYTLNFRNKSKLSFGAKGGINLVSLRTNQLDVPDALDPALISNVSNRVLPNFGAGVYYHNTKFFLGISSPKLLEDSYLGTSASIEQRHYFLIAGGVIKLNPAWKLRPTTHLKFTAGSPLSIDLSAAFIYNDKWWLGIMHRWADSFGGFVQFQMTDQFKVGLAYDQTVTELATYNRGTFEVMLNYDFKFNTNGIKTPRYF